MAGSLNKAMLIGHLGADPEIRTLQNGSKIASMRLATSESWRDKNTGERKERTEWHTVVVWNENLVRVIEQYAKKGSKLYVEGQIQTRKYQDKSGQDRYATEIVLQAYGGTVTLLDTQNGGDRRGGTGRQDDTRRDDPPREQGNRRKHADLDDDIPF